VDTLQYKDDKGLDLLLENFPRGFHEPYYDSYCRTNFESLAEEYGLVQHETDIGFLTKVMVFKKRA